MRGRLTALCMRWAGWTAVGKRPDASKVVIVAAPHTSNWDLVVYILTAWVLGVPLSWMGKHTLFAGPLGPLMRALGGIPVYRHLRLNAVEQMTRVFAENEELYLVVTPEGTRGYVDHWKSGFYHIAVAAGVPISFGFLDYPSKCCGLGPLLLPTGDVSHDMDQARAFYADKVGKFPEQAGRPRLREEDEPARVAAGRAEE